MDKPYKFSIVVSKFNQPITQALLDGALERLSELNIQKEQVRVAWVPGAVELPLIAQKMAETRQYEAVICLGVVIRGETGHYDHVCQQASLGCQQVALQYSIPVIFGVLTTENKDQALARAGGDRGNKGRDSVDAAVEMVDMMREFA